MDWLRSCTMTTVSLLFFALHDVRHCPCSTGPGGECTETKYIYSKIFGSLFAFSANSPATTSAVTGSSFWEKVITMFSRVQASIFPPNLDFRWSDEAVGRGGGTGTGEKMKEGAAKSVEKGKAAVEDSARSAAKVASETVQKIKEKRSHKTETEPQDEL